MALFKVESKKREKEIDKVSHGQLSTPGVYVSAGEIQQSDYDTTTTETLLRDYTAMRNEDAIASSSLDVIINTISNSSFNIRPGYINEEKPSDIAVEAANYVYWCYNKLWPSINDYLYHKNLAWPFGFILFEKIYQNGVEYIDSKGIKRRTNIITRLAPIQHDTIYDYYYNDKGYFIGIRQERRKPDGGSSLVDIPYDKLYLFTPFPEFGNVTGRSLLRPARRAWRYKTDIWKASTRAATRGAGIPTFTIGAGVSPGQAAAYLSKAQTMGRTIGNSENVYMVEEADKLTFRLEALANQQDNMNLINLANSEMFYNTLTHMVQSGIGQNGSRSATEEHKSPFLETVNYFMRLLDESETALIKEMVELSYLYNQLDTREYPYAVRERLKDQDLEAMSANILRLAQSQAIRINDKDEQYLRELFGLPELSLEEISNEETAEEEEAAPKEAPEQEEQEVIEAVEMAAEVDSVITGEDPVTGNPTTPATDLADQNIERARDLFDTIGMTAQDVLQKYYNRLVENVAGQLAKRPDEKPKFRYKQELIKELETLFDAGFTRGRADVKAEAAEIEGLQLQSDNLRVSGLGDALQIKIDFLYDSLENAINETLAIATQQQIENVGGMKKFIQGEFTDGNKKLRSGITTLIQSGYTSGRNDELQRIAGMNPEKEIVYEYNASLENDPQNICEVCYPLHGARFTRPELEAAGLTIVKGIVNPSCLGFKGGNLCRCQWKQVAAREFV